LIAQGATPTPCPELLPGLDFYFTAFNQLQHDRPVGMSGMGSIPYSSIITWSHINGIDNVDDIATLEHHLRAMERASYQFEETNKGK